MGGGSSAHTCQGCGLSEKGPENIRLLHSPQNSWIFRRGEKLGEPNVKRGQDRTGLASCSSPQTNNTALGKLKIRCLLCKVY